jgi:aflatoxin B1 aldehyde reductase
MTGQRTSPKVILGTMTFGLDTTVAETSSVRIRGIENVKPFLDTFHKYGHTELDTARVYCGGDTETALGLIDTSAFKIATKVWPTGPKSHGSELLRKTFLQSLAALKTEKVDIFYLHAPDYTTPFEETVKAINDLYLEGRFERVGYCALVSRINVSE